MTPNCQPDRPDWFPAACAVAFVVTIALCVAIALLCMGCAARRAIPAVPPPPAPPPLLLRPAPAASPGAACRALTAAPAPSFFSRLTAPFRPAPAASTGAQPATPAPAPASPVTAGGVIAAHPSPAPSVPDPGATEPHYRLRLQVGPTVSGILPAYVSPVECRIPVAELQQRLALAADQARLDALRDRLAADAAARERLRWLFGVPLIVIGLALLAGGVFLLIKGANLGADLAVLGTTAAALGLVLYLYPREAGWCAATAVALAILYAIWRAWDRDRAQAALADVVNSVDAARAAITPAFWSRTLRPILSRQQPATRARVERIQASQR